MVIWEGHVIQCLEGNEVPSHPLEVMSKRQYDTRGFKGCNKEPRLTMLLQKDYLLCTLALRYLVLA